MKLFPEFSKKKKDLNDLIDIENNLTGKTKI